MLSDRKEEAKKIEKFLMQFDPPRLPPKSTSKQRKRKTTKGAKRHSTGSTQRKMIRR
jgi:hypothetical protein